MAALATTASSRKADLSMERNKWPQFRQSGECFLYSSASRTVSGSGDDDAFSVVGTSANPSPHDRQILHARGIPWAAMICAELPGLLCPLAGNNHRLLAEAVVYVVYRRHQGAGFRARLFE